MAEQRYAIQFSASNSGNVLTVNSSGNLAWDSNCVKYGDALPTTIADFK